MSWHTPASPPPPQTGPTLFDVDEGRARRDDGVDHAGDGAPAALTAGWRVLADEAIGDLARTGREFSADNLVLRVGEPPVPNMLGGVFLAAAKRGLIRGVGYRPGTRPAAHARVQRVWVGQVVDGEVLP